MSARDWIMVIVLGTIWGSSFVFNGILLAEMGPVWVSAGRVTVSAIGCWAYFVILRKTLPREWMLYVHFFVLGTINFAIPFALFPLAQHHVASGVAAIVNAMTPLVTVVVSHFWPGGERATWIKGAGVVAGLGGVAVLASPALASGGSSQIWAIGLCLGATLCYAVALNYTRGLRRVDPVVMAACAFTGASVSAVIGAFIMDGVPHNLSATGWGSLLALGLVATAFTFQVMYRVLPRIGATNFAVTTFIAPVSTIILGATILGEALQPAHLAGMGAIFLGLLLIDGRIGRLWRRKAAGSAL